MIDYGLVFRMKTGLIMIMTLRASGTSKIRLRSSNLESASAMKKKSSGNKK